MKFLHSRWFVYSILFLILLLAAGFRLHQLGVVPGSLYWDEAADGYNAYSILHTGKDEYGNSFPILFRSFDDYKMPGMVYFMSLGIALFGLNEFAIRFFDVVFGVIMVGLTFLFVEELFRLDSIDRLFKLKHKESAITTLALVSAFLLAISPWHIQFTRTGYEASMGATLLLAGMLFFLKALRRSNYLFLSALFIALSLYFYRSMFPFLAVFLPVVGLIFFSELTKKLPRHTLLLSALLFMLTAFPITYAVFTPPGNSRAGDVSIFNNVKDKVDRNQLWAIQSGNGFLGNIFFNKRFVYLNEFLNNYSSHFTMQFLFLNGDANERHSTRNMGMMYLWELPFFLLGIYLILVRSARQVKLLVFAWLLIAPIPAGLSIFAPHALRTFNILPIPQIFVAVGLVAGWYLFRPLFRPVYAGFVLLLIAFFLSSYFFNYYHLSTILSAKAWGDGYKQMNEYVKQHEKAYDVVLISGHYWEPYVYTLFYTGYDPKTYQESGTSRRFGKYIFGGTSWEQHGPPELGKDDLIGLVNRRKALVVLSPDEYTLQQDNLREVSRIQGIDNSTVFIIGEFNLKQHETQ